MTIKRFPIFQFGALSNITPFTYSDGVTYLSVLTKITDYLSGDLAESLQEFVTGVDDRILRDREDMEKALGEFIATIEERFDALAAAAAVEAVNLYLADPATVDLAVSLKMGDSESKTYDATEKTVVEWIGNSESPVHTTSERVTAEWIESPDSSVHSTSERVTSEWIESPDSDVNRAAVGVFDSLSLDRVGTEGTDLKNLLNSKFMRREETGAVFVDGIRGDNSNPGTSDEPLKTIQAGIDRAVKYATTDEFTVNIGPAVYQEKLLLPDFTPYNLRIRLAGQAVGGHPAQPITVVQAPANGLGSGLINRNQNASIVIENILFRGWKGSPSSYGVNNLKGKVTTDNVHARDCYLGVSSYAGELIVPNGIISDCTTGILSSSNNRHTIGVQDGTDRSRTLLIENCSTAISVSSASTGHVDAITIRDCIYGLSVANMSRVNVETTLFQRVNLAVRAQVAGQIQLSRNYEMVDVIQPVQTWGGGSVTTDDTGQGQFLNGSYGRRERHQIGTYAPRYARGAGEVDMFRRDFNPDWFRETYTAGDAGARKMIIRGRYAVSGSTTKTLHIRALEAYWTVVIPAETVGTVFLDMEIWFISPTRQYVFGKVVAHNGWTRTFNIEKNTGLNSGAIRITAETGSGSEIMSMAQDVSIVE